MRKISSLLLILSLISMIGLVSAQDYEYPSYVQGEYNGEVNFEVDKNGGDADGGLSVNVCGETADAAETSGGTGQGGVATVEYPAQISFNIPEDAPCSVGNNEIELVRGSIDGMTQETIGTIDLEVNAQGMDNHVGRNILVSMDITGDTFKLKNFMLTNDVWQVDGWSAGGVETGNIFVQYFDNDLIGNSHQYGQWELAPGQSPIMYNTEAMTTFINSQEGAGYSSVQENAWKVTDTWYSQENSFEYGDLESVWNINSQSPLHDDGSWYLDGQVILGYYPENYLNSGTQEGPTNQFTQDDRLFFVCREGADMPVDTTEGISTSQVVNVDSDDQSLYKCDQDAGEWNPVEECNDGIDNDGDGTIDGSNDYNAIGTNPNCETSDYESTVGSEVCYPGEETPCVPEFTCEDSPLATQHPNGTTYAYYDTGDGCEFTKWSEWEVTTTLNDGSLAISNPDEFSCSYSETSTNEDCPPESQWSEDWENDGSMPVTEYGALPNHFRNLADAKNRDLTTQGVSSQFVEQNNGWVSQTQGLHTAERRYDIDQIGGQTGSINEGNCGSGFISYSGDDVEVDCESWEWWDSRNLSDAELNYETSSDVTDRKGSWRPANAGTTSGVRDETGDEDYVFKGGWAGECGPDGFWTVMDDDRAWACDSSTPVSTSFGGGGGGGGGGCCDEGIEIPKFGTSAYLPDTEKYTENDVEKREIGMIQFPYINQAGDTPEYIPSDVYSYRNLVGDVNGDGDPDEITQLRAECWTGGLSDKPDDIDNSERAFHTTTSPRQDDVWGVSQVVETGGLNGYACYWGYETAERSEIVLGDSEESVVHLHRNQEPGTDYYGFWEGVSTESEYGLQESYDKGELSQELN